MDERLSNLVTSVIGLTDTISTLESIRDRLGADFTDKEREVFESCISMYVNARYQNLTQIGLVNPQPVTQDTPPHVEGGSDDGDVGFDKQQNDKPPQRDAKRVPQKQHQKPAQSGAIKKEQDYPD
jgi:hypothetical protein